MLLDRPSLGAPGVYPVATPPARALLGARMDVCAFVGVAPRGPAREPFTDEQWLEAGLRPTRPLPSRERSGVEPERPRRRSVAVAVESWDEYRRLFGAFEGPGLLPYAVASFFEQGGRRAYVVRIVHDYCDGRDREGVAQGTLSGLRVGGAPAPIVFNARNEGSWGSRLRVELELVAQPLLIEAGSTHELILPPGTTLPAGSLVRLSLGGGARQLRFVAACRIEPRHDRPGRKVVATLDAPLAAIPHSVEVVEAVVTVDDYDGRVERHDRVGLGADHPRRLALVLTADSTLVRPDPAWADDDLLPVGDSLPGLVSDPFTPPEELPDRYADIVPDDFFDAEFVLGDEGPASGVHAVLAFPEIALLVAPDLYEPAPLPDLEDIREPPSLAGPEFRLCVPLKKPEDQHASPPELEGLMLDPRSQFERIVSYQRRLVELADLMRSFIVLLDVPPGLDRRRVLDWRASFDSAFGAGYHPWLKVSRTNDRRNQLVRLNPSAVAAGIVANRERAFGVAFGPANEFGVRVVDVEERLSPVRHDELHQVGIDVFLRERDGIRLTASRTLSLDRAYRQLSVRRLVTMIERTLERELQGLVFEPNTDSLRADVQHVITAYLRRLYRAGSFAGATESQSFFVRCDEQLNSQAVVDAGRLVAEIGVAPVEPIEFLIVRVTRDGDGTLLVEGSRG